MKTFCVCYNVTVSYDTKVAAQTKKEAIEKVREVIGDPVEIEGAWEVKPDEAK